MSIDDKPNADSPRKQLLVAAIDRVFDELASTAESNDSQLFFDQMADRLVELFPECTFVVWAGVEDSQTVVINRRGSDCQSVEIDFQKGASTSSIQSVSDDLSIGFCWPAQAAALDREQLRLRTEVLREAANIGREHLRISAVASNGGGESSDRLFEFTNRCHSTLELKTVASHLVAGSEKLLNADRVWLFSGKSGEGRKPPRLLACSSVSEVDSRSQDLELVSGVAQEALRLGASTFASHAELESLPQERSATFSYLKRFKSNGLYACLLDEHSPVDVLIVECFEPHDRLRLATSLSKIPIAARPALANAREHESIPFRKTLKRFSSSSPVQGIGWKRILALASLLGFIATFFVKVDFEIPVDGLLKPATECNVFAPTDGTVTSILVDYGDSVQAGEQLLVIHSTDYELKLKQTQGELLSASKELESNQLLRSQASKSGDELKVGQLTSQIEQVNLRIRSLNEKSDFYLKQLASLTLAAPIEGKITTEKMQQMLMNRPVRAGDPLVSIAEVDGDWHAELEIKSTDVSYLGQQENASHTIRFRSMASIQREHAGQVAEIDGFNSIDENGDISVRAFVPINKDDFENLRVGTPITGVIHCGRRSVAFVWTREIRDFFRTNFFWF